MSVALGSLAGGKDAAAVIEPGRGITSYGELDQLADGVAARLRGLGLQPGARVGIYLRRSADAVAAILGALRAGCAYVPVDTTAPSERNAEIHADCRVALTLVEARFEPGYRAALARLDASVEVHAIDEVGAGRAIRAWATAGDGAERAWSEIACILYTSGSTGRHKGWLMSRAAIEAHVAWARRLLEPGPGDVFASSAPFSFGMSLFDLFTSLGSGAALLLVPDDLRQFARHVADLIARERATIWFSTPGILTLLAALPDLETRDLGALRAVAFAGEVFPVQPLSALRRRLPRPRYFNFWGSTETNVGFFHELRPDAPLDQPPPIGRPCAHYEARVVGPEGELAAPGAPGELQLRGAGLTTGYLNRPELTSERLTAAPDGGPPWYRTGDLAIELPDGNVQYAGRIGRMVKLRGYRVEPGEVEARLYQHPGVREVGVVPIDGPNGLRLVAHISGARLPIVELKEFCAVKLPPYMIPEWFVFHDALPRTPRGKLDLTALQEARP